MSKLVDEFRAFLLKSNALALAIGVIIGAATGKLVSSLTGDILMPIIGKLTGGMDFSNYYVNLTPDITYENYAKAKEAGAALGYGMFINTVIDFVIIAFVVFMITKALIKEKPKPPGPKTKVCPVCGETVLEVAGKCKWCLSEL